MKRNLIIAASAGAILLLASGVYFMSEKSRSSTTENIHQENQEQIEGIDVRQQAWEQLSQEQKDMIDGDWEDGTLSTVVLREEMVSNLKDSSQIGKEVYSIEFKKKNKDVSTNMIVYADKEFLRYIGDGLVD